MSDALEVAAEVLGVDRVEQVAELGGSRRSVVRRVRAGAESFIVKEYEARAGVPLTRPSW